MQTILVTGGKGMLSYGIKQATKLPPYSKYNFIYVDIEDADLCDKGQAFDLFKKYNPDGVIHLAADVGGLFKNMEHGVEMHENNLLINMHVMQGCKEFGVHKLVSCLSTCIFPEPSMSPHIKLPLDETMIHQGPPHPSNQGYAYAKRMVDVQSQYYRKQYNCNFITLAPTNIFGPNDNFSLESSHVIPALIRKCYTALIEKHDFVVWGTGKPLRQFIYSLDLAKLFLWAFLNYNEAEPLILAPGEEYEISIGQVAQYVADAFGYQKELVFNTSYSDGQFKRTVSNKKLMDRNPEFQFTPIETAIRETVDWFKANYSNARL